MYDEHEAGYRIVEAITEWHARRIKNSIIGRPGGPCLYPAPVIVFPTWDEFEKVRIAVVRFTGLRSELIGMGNSIIVDDVRVTGPDPDVLRLVKAFPLLA